MNIAEQEQDQKPNPQSYNTLNPRQTPTLLYRNANFFTRKLQGKHNHKQTLDDLVSIDQNITQFSTAVPYFRSWKHQNTTPRKTNNNQVLQTTNMPQKNPELKTEGRNTRSCADRRSTFMKDITLLRSVKQKNKDFSPAFCNAMSLLARQKNRIHAQQLPQNLKERNSFIKMVQDERKKKRGTNKSKQKMIPILKQGRNSQNIFIHSKTPSFRSSGIQTISKYNRIPSSKLLWQSGQYQIQPWMIKQIQF